ncbi:MAG: Septum formation initiator family protein [Patescibacteria group bacterium]|nr:Septum formation initiator family protein [Patescibacteria group bacterium]
MKPTLKDKIFDYTRLAFWVGLIATVYVMAALVNLSAKNTAVREKADKVEEEIVVLENDVEALKAQIAYYQSDAYKERFAREKLGLQTSGEQVVVVGRGDAERGADKNDDVQASTLPQKSHLEEWGDFLFGEQ